MCITPLLQLAGSSESSWPLMTDTRSHRLLLPPGGQHGTVHSDVKWTQRSRSNYLKLQFMTEYNTCMLKFYLAVQCFVLFCFLNSEIYRLGFAGSMRQNLHLIADTTCSGSSKPCYIIEPQSFVLKCQALKCVNVKPQINLPTDSNVSRTNTQQSCIKAFLYLTITLTEHEKQAESLLLIRPSITFQSQNSQSEPYVGSTKLHLCLNPWLCAMCYTLGPVSGPL